jgi:hypothetical protein
MHKIQFNNDNFEFDSNISILECLNSKIINNSNSCNQGSCGTCKIKFLLKHKLPNWYPKTNIQEGIIKILNADKI